MQRRLGTRGKAGFYRREGTIVQTVYGRLCFTRKPRLTVDALSAVADAMGEFPEAFWAEARALREEHDATVARACSSLGVNKDTFASQVAAGKHRA